MSDNKEDLLKKMQEVASAANETAPVRRRVVQEEPVGDVQIADYETSSDEEVNVVKQESTANFSNGEVEAPQIEETIKNAASDKMVVTVPDIDFSNLLEDFEKNVRVLDGGPMGNVTINRFLNTKPTYNVVALHSAYEAKISAMTLVDKSAIRNSTDTAHAMRSKIYHVVYDHIESMSVHKPPFEDWCKVTSFHDIETLLFGLYAQTYAHNNSFDITCPVCKTKNKVKADASSLIQVKDPEAFGVVRDIIQSVTNWTELKGRSQVGVTHRFMLPDSKIIVQAKSPSLYEHLNMLKAYNPNLAHVGEIFAFSLFIKELYLPNLDELAKGNVVYAKVTGRDDINTVITRFTDEDEKAFNDNIRIMTDKFKLEFKIDEFDCVASGCTHHFESIPLDIENLLFFRVFEQK